MLQWAAEASRCLWGTDIASIGGGGGGARGRGRKQATAAAIAAAAAAAAAAAGAGKDDDGKDGAGGIYMSAAARQAARDGLKVGIFYGGKRAAMTVEDVMEKGELLCLLSWLLLLLLLLLLLWLLLLLVVAVVVVAASAAATSAITVIFDV